MHSRYLNFTVGDSEGGCDPLSGFSVRDGHPLELRLQHCQLGGGHSRPSALVVSLPSLAVPRR